MGARTFQYRSKGKDHTHVLSEEAVAVLKRLDPKPAGRVFRHRSETVFRCRWDVARKAIGKPRLRLHDLRVTFARDLSAAGAYAFTIRDLRGHSTFTMTSRYVGTSPENQRRALEELVRIRSSPP